MNRREALAITAALAAAVTTTATAADHSHHHGAANAPLLDATAQCMAKGEACLAHCLVLLGQGDKAMGECATAVNQMLAACTALNKLAAQGSRLVKSMAGVAREACSECEAACRKHAEKHAECKACLDACVECGKQCKAAIA